MLRVWAMMDARQIIRDDLKRRNCRPSHYAQAEISKVALQYLNEGRWAEFKAQALAKAYPLLRFMNETFELTDGQVPRPLFWAKFLEWNEENKRLGLSFPGVRELAKEIRKLGEPYDRLIDEGHRTGSEPRWYGADNALSLLQAVYRDQELPLPVRMRAAALALPFESPKLSAIANLSPEDFSDRLEKAITRSGVRLIEAKGER